MPIYTSRDVHDWQVFGLETRTAHAKATKRSLENTPHTKVCHLILSWAYAKGQDVLVQMTPEALACGDVIAIALSMV
jgi:hypothetical protein